MTFDEIMKIVGGGWPAWIALAVGLVVYGVWTFWSGRSEKEKQLESDKTEVGKKTGQESQDDAKKIEDARKEAEDFLHPK